MEPTETFKVGSLTVKIIPEEQPESPREWDNLGTMVCWHRRYNLGDKHKYADPEDFEEWAKDEELVRLPLILLDHSGLSMSTNKGYPYNCQYDAGQVGWIYATKKEVTKEYGDFSEESQEKAKQLLVSEVETYDQYLRGDVWGYDIEDQDGEHVDSCWGFFGFDYCKQEATEIAEAKEKPKGTQLELPL